jgi:hypothetical protein
MSWSFDNVFDTNHLQVAASFNPWSQFNVIGPNEAVFDTPMLYPYNRDQSIKIHILDKYGKVVNSLYGGGFIDLDLIVDNTSSYAIDS